MNGLGEADGGAGGLEGSLGIGPDGTHCTFPFASGMGKLSPLSHPVSELSRDRDARDTARISCRDRAAGSRTYRRVIG